MSEERLSEAKRLVADALQQHVEGCDEFDLGADALCVLGRVLEPIPESIYKGRWDEGERFHAAEAYRQYLLNGENNGVQ